MSNRTRSIVSFFTILTTLVFTLTIPAAAQKTDRETSPSAPTAVLYANSSLKTGTANGANGSDISQIAAGGTAFGQGMNGTGSPQVLLGDRFTLASASTVSSIVFFPYSTAAAGAYGNPPTPPFTGATVSIWNGQPGSGGTIVATSSTFGGSAWTGLYKIGRAHV